MISDSFDHIDRFIMDLLPQIIDTGLPVVGPYLESRVRTLKYMKNSKRLNRGIFLDKRTEEEDPKQIVETCLIWEDLEKLRKKIFEDVELKDMDAE